MRSLPVPDLPITMVLAIAFSPSEFSPGRVAWKIKVVRLPVGGLQHGHAFAPGILVFLPEAKLCSGESPRKFSELTLARRRAELPVGRQLRVERRRHCQILLDRHETGIGKLGARMATFCDSCD